MVFSTNTNKVQKGYLIQQSYSFARQYFYTIDYVKFKITEFGV